MTAPDGTVRSQPIGDLIEVTTRRDFVSVTISVPETEVTALGGGRAALSVASAASLLPVEVPGDREPLTDAEIADATGPHRALADEVGAMHDDKIVFARMTNRMINALPEFANPSTATRFRLWRSLFGKDPVGAANLGELQAQGAFFDCRRDLMAVVHDGMRACLAEYQDRAMYQMTVKVWKALNTGS